MEHTGTVIKSNKRKKYGTILPDQWKSLRQDVYYETVNYEFSDGDKVAYTYLEKKGRRYAENVEKIG